MITLILATFLTATPAPEAVAQFRPCVWPNTCKTVAAPVAAPVIAAGPITTCVWPNKCG
mgnify:CR=1 FL=1